MIFFFGVGVYVWLFNGIFFVVCFYCVIFVVWSVDLWYVGFGVIR